MAGIRRLSGVIDLKSHERRLHLLLPAPVCGVREQAVLYMLPDAYDVDVPARHSRHAKLSKKPVGPLGLH